MGAKRVAGLAWNRLLMRVDNSTKKGTYLKSNLWLAKTSQQPVSRTVWLKVPSRLMYIEVQIDACTSKLKSCKSMQGWVFPLMPHAHPNPSLNQGRAECLVGCLKRKPSAGHVSKNEQRPHTHTQTHTQAHTHTHACTHTRTRTRMHTRAHTHMHTHTHTHAHMRTRTHIHTHTCTHTHAQTHTYTHACTNTHIHTRMHKHTYTRMHTRMHTHTHTLYATQRKCGCVKGGA